MQRIKKINQRIKTGLLGLARIYIDESFIVNNVNILQGKENIFVSMPAYKTKQNDEQGKPIYQDVCYPVTKEFREKLYTEIVREYEQAKEKSQDQTKDNAEKPAGNRVNQQERDATPFR